MKPNLQKEVVTNLKKKTMKSIIDIVMLAELKKGLKSGYDLITAINEKFGVFVSSGTVYSHLYALERNEIISGVNYQTKRSYKLTEKGSEHLELLFASIKKMLDTLEQDMATDTYSI